MEWEDLQLWAEEEKRIHSCLVTALQQLIASQSVVPDDDELTVSGKLRPYLRRAKKQLNLIPILQFEAASFEEPESPKPYGHPDIRFSFNTPDYDQYEYDVECKLIRVKRQGKRHDYCKYYVTDGVKRFQDNIYAQLVPPMGALIGYLQEGEFLSLLEAINNACRDNDFQEIQLKPQSAFSEKDVTSLTQQLERSSGSLILSHFWADIS